MIGASNCSNLNSTLSSHPHTCLRQTTYIISFFSLCLPLFTVESCILFKILSAPPWRLLSFLILLNPGVDIRLALTNEMWAEVTCIISEQKLLRDSLCCFVTLSLSLFFFFFFGGQEIINNPESKMTYNLLSKPGIFESDKMNYWEWKDMLLIITLEQQT